MEPLQDTPDTLTRNPECSDRIFLYHYSVCFFSYVLQEYKSGMHTVAIILAAGRGMRAGPGDPKQYRSLAGRPVLAWSAETFLSHPAISAVRIIIHPDDRLVYGEKTASLKNREGLLDPVAGGSRRQDSVRLALESITGLEPSRVLIHDAARPFTDSATITRVLTALETCDGAIAALPVHDTLKRGSNGVCPQIVDTIPRESLWHAQTPQGFRFSGILDAHRRFREREWTDDAAVAEHAGLRIRLVQGAFSNMKVTCAEDFGIAEMLLAGMKEDKRTGMEYRTGTGFDVHAFEDGDMVTICGIEIPHSRKLKGHSDADVGMHALTDAIFGAIGAGDIGEHFPPSDDRYKGAPSRMFLEKAYGCVRACHGHIVNADITLICETPAMTPYKLLMRRSLAAILDMDPARISVKATTSEKLGFTGRSEGIAAMATVSVCLPDNAGES